MKLDDPLPSDPARGGARPRPSRARKPRALAAPQPLAPSLERRRLQIYLLLLVADALVIVAGFSFAGFLYFGEWFQPMVLLEAQLVLPVYWTFAIGNNAYTAGAALDARVGALRAILALLAAVAAVVFIAFYLKTVQSFSRVVSTLGTIATVIGLAIARDLLSGLARWHCGPTAMNVLVIDDGGRMPKVPHAITVHAGASELRPDAADPHALHRIALFLRNMDRVVVACPPERRRAWAMVLKGAAVQGEIVDDDIADLGAVGAHRSPDYASLIIARGPLRLTNRALKRGLDLAIALSAVVVLSPLLVAVALAIKLEDGGPVFFVQRRLGRNNGFFDIYKFRSMRVASHDHDGAVSATQGDARTTRVGRLIRATSIDELPQLANVLLGHMSVVGPRPHALGSQAGEKLFWQIDQRYWQRHALKPGMTGLAQVRGFRGETIHEHGLTSRLQTDLEYLDGWTIWRDLAIHAATLRVLVHRKAY